MDNSIYVEVIGEFILYIQWNPALRPPCYYGQIFWPIGDCINGVPLYLPVPGLKKTWLPAEPIAQAAVKFRLPLVTFSLS